MLILTLISIHILTRTRIATVTVMQIWIWRRKASPISTVNQTATSIQQVTLTPPAVLIQMKIWLRLMMRNSLNFWFKSMHNLTSKSVNINSFSHKSPSI